VPHIQVSNELNGIRSLLAYKPATGTKIAQLIHEMLRGSSPLSAADRERIAAHVSQLNECEFCARSHGAAIRHLDAVTAAGVTSGGVDGGTTQQPPLEAVDAAPEPKLKALLALAEAVARGGQYVTDDLVASARSAGAGDEDIHDTVLIAAAFSMLNRYVDGLDAVTPSEDAAYDAMGRQMAAHGYLRAAPTVE